MGNPWTGSKKSATNNIGVEPSKIGDRILSSLQPAWLSGGGCLWFHW